MFQDIGLIVNRCPRPDVLGGSPVAGIPLLSVIPQDDAMCLTDLMGKSIFELPADSPILQGAAQALKKLGIL